MNVRRDNCSSRINDDGELILNKLYAMEFSIKTWLLRWLDIYDGKDWREMSLNNNSTRISSLIFEQKEG